MCARFWSCSDRAGIHVSLSADLHRPRQPRLALPLGSVSALTYGWMILQVPETLIGTAIGTALLPTISEMIARNQRAEFAQTVNRVIRVFIALAVPSAILLALALPPLLDFAFGFDTASTSLLLWVTRAFWPDFYRTACSNWAPEFFRPAERDHPFIAAAINLIAYIAFGCCCSVRWQRSAWRWRTRSPSPRNPLSCWGSLLCAQPSRVGRSEN